MGIYEIGFNILIYSFIGWCVEVIYHTVTYGEFSNRGFVNGPVCTIYGFGFTAVVLILSPLKSNLLLLFLGSFVVTTGIEFLTGWLLEKIFNEKWWDYTEEKFNIRGYICLKFSLLWGLACTSVLIIIQPLVDGLVERLPWRVVVVILVLSLAIWIADNIITVLEIRRIYVQLRVMKEISENMRKLSDFIGENLHVSTVSLMEMTEEEREEFKEKVDEFKTNTEERVGEFRANTDMKIEEWKENAGERMEELRSRYEKLMGRESMTLRRLHKAFPSLKLERRFKDKGSRNRE